ncbi:MAG TPA: hypothetical protein VF239_18595, partial [Vicinamibacterales bacterium]
MRHHRFERRTRQLDREIEIATMTFIDHRAIGHVGADVRRANEESSDCCNRTLRGREADALRSRFAHDVIETLERQR